jgi:5-formyltetrahydrofolate cyclo-ligase
MSIGLSLSEAKGRLRREMRARRDALSLEERRERSGRIFRRLSALPLFQGADLILFYASFGSEVETWEMMKASQAYGKRIALPRVEEASGDLLALEVKDLGQDLSPGYKAIPEPKRMGSRRVQGDEISLILVPGLAFDGRGYRLGYGKGYYDRFLSGLSRNIPAAGLAFDFQIVESLPVSSADFCLNLIVTENRIIWGERASGRSFPGRPLTLG